MFKPQLHVRSIPNFVPPIVLGVLILIVGCLNLSLSMRQGSLAMPPIYDDVGYLLDAYSRLASEQVSSIFGIVRSFYNDPPHAPFSTLTAMLGFALVGPTVVGPYMVNIWALALYGFAIYAIGRRYVSPPVSLLIAACLLFAPAPHLLMSEFRPDIAAGVVFSVALYALIFTEYSSMVACAIAGLLTALAIIAKPTAFVATIPILGVAWMIGAVRPLDLSVSDRGQRFKNALVVLLVAGLVLVPFGLIWGPSIVRYAYDALVTHRDVWASSGSSFFHWTFYSFGGGGSRLLGWFFKAGACAIVFDIALSVRLVRNSRASYSALAYYAILVPIYVGLALDSGKSVYLGSYFGLPWLFATALACARLLSRVSGTVRAAASLSGTLACCLVASPTSQHQDSRTWPEATEIRNAVLAAIEAIPNSCSRPRSIAVFAPYPVTVEAIALEAALRGYDRLVPKQLFFSASVDEMVAGAMASDFVLGPNRFGATVQSNLPGFKFLAQAEAVLDGDSKWKRIALPGLADPPVLYHKACR